MELEQVKEEEKRLSRNVSVASSEGVKTPLSANDGTRRVNQETAEVSASKSSRKGQNKLPKREPVLYNHLPSAIEEATSLFEVIPDCIYGSKNMGNSDNDVLDCDCRPEIVDGVNMSCSEDHCINRATKCECVIGSAACGDNCQNQRFQRKQYANVDVIKTEKKGFGLRANEDLYAHQFIFEYIGDVINEATFRRRMLKYDDQGIKHFYFMSLTRTEFVDATIKGNLGRFCNHSCNPNCYVDKWAVGTKLRMGIFALREIKAGEELVFNYNVDRYGAQPQVCYCGELNCVGFIGGKTQTEKATKLNHDVAEALGIEDGDSWDTVVAKKPRKKKTGEDDDAYIDESATAKILDEKSVKRVMTVLMQRSEKWVVIKLLERIKACSEERVLNQVVRMHAYQTMKKLLNTFKDDDDTVLLILQVLDKFPRITNNKIQASNITQSVETCVQSSNEDVSAAATHLLAEWAKLKAGYRITKRANGEAYEQDDIYGYGRQRATDSPSTTVSTEKKPPSPILNAPTGPKSNTPQRNPNMIRNPALRRFPYHNNPTLAAQQAAQQQLLQFQSQLSNQPLPDGWHMAYNDTGTPYYFNAAGETTWIRPTALRVAPQTTAKPPTKQQILDQIIDAVNNEAKKKMESPTTSTPQRNQSPEPLKKLLKPEESLEKRKKHYENTLAPHVIRMASKFKKSFNRDNFKQLAGEVCKTLVESDFKHGRVDNPRAPLSSDQIRKVEKYVYGFFKKAVAKLQSKAMPSTSAHSESRNGQHCSHTESSQSQSQSQSQPRQEHQTVSVIFQSRPQQIDLDQPPSTNNSAPASISTVGAHEDTPMSSHSSPGSDGRQKRKRDGSNDGEDTTMTDASSMAAKRMRENENILATVAAIAAAAGAVKKNVVQPANIAPPVAAPVSVPPPPSRSVAEEVAERHYKESEAALIKENEEAEREEAAQKNSMQ